MAITRTATCRPCPPESDQQQACVTAVADTDAYNWGYDPMHYTTPEGSYATDAERRRAHAAVPQHGRRAQQAAACGS